jgi:hypothetical protein
VTVDEAAMISVGHSDELTLDIHRHRPNSLGPSGRQIAGAIVFLLLALVPDFAAMSSLLVSGFRVIGKHSSAKQRTSDHD